VENKSAQILARKASYDRIERASDESGRVIGVKRLKPSQQLRIREMAPGLDGTVTVFDEKSGKLVEVAKITPLIIAASVAEIDQIPVSFPKSRAELDAMIDALDDDGLTAATTALSKFAPVEGEDSGVDEAKN
jgi:hypothetical protein